MSQQLAKRQQEMLDAAGDELLRWFCDADITDPSNSNLEVRFA